MDSELEERLHNSLTPLGISRKAALSMIRKANLGKSVSEEAVSRALDGFGFCLNQMADETSDQKQVWEWFSNRHLPALGKTALEASLQDDPRNVEAFLHHIREGGYA